MPIGRLVHGVWHSSYGRWIAAVERLGAARNEVLQLPLKIKNNGSMRAKASGGVASTVPQVNRDGEDVTSRTSRFAASSARVAVSFLAIAVLSGCGMSSLTSGIGGSVFGGGSTTASAPKRITEEGMLTAAKANSAGSGLSEIAHGCPRFQVWPRDHHVTIYEPGRIGDGLAVMHRGEITKTARECSVAGNRVTVKYGFSGRVLLGPRGKSGRVVLPVKVFATDSKRDRIANDQATIEVNVGLEQPIGYFSSVRTVSFDVPEGSRPGEIDIFVGFDRNAPGAG